MKLIRNSSRLAMLALVLLLCITGCKSKKKALEASNAAAEKARIEREDAARRQKEEELRIAEQKRKEAEDQARREEEERKRREAANTPTARLGQYFNAIASAGSTTAANNSITEALSLFASPETPVLIVISESGGQKDYDRPTTIKQYLNYLKDQKKNINKISDLRFDGSGKITEVELSKN
ncbi:MAG: nucleoid-structuring protein H-NS [Azospira oryzae]|jgi:hypothetical protein|nr:MAG: nucleoid-structuring protein H-NS [Azospira oryzae]